MSATSDLVRRIVTGFLEPALAFSGEDWRLKWRAVNRGAGVIVGWAFAQDAAILRPQDAPALAQRLVADVEEAFLTRATDMDRVNLLNGLAKRVAAVLVEMGA